MRRTAWFGAALLSGAALLVACSDDGGEDGGMAGSAMANAGSSGSGGGGGGGMVSFSEIHPIFVEKCGDSDCHVGNGLPPHGAEDIDVAYEAATGDSLYAVGPLYEEILARSGPNSESLMPPSYGDPPCLVFGEGGCLTQAEYDLIQQWVDDGLNP